MSFLFGPFSQNPKMVVHKCIFHHFFPLCQNLVVALKGMNQHKRSSSAGGFLKNVINSFDYSRIFEKEAVSYMRQFQSKCYLLQE